VRPPPDAAADEAQPDLDGNDGHRQARKKLEHERREERHAAPSWWFGGIVRHRLHCPLRAGPTEYPKSRQPFDDVEENDWTSAQGLPLIVGAALGGQSGKHHEEQDNGKGQQQHDPEIQSVAQTTTTNSGEMIAVNTSCGRYRAKYASSASNPRGGQLRDLSGAMFGRPRCTGVNDAAHQALSQLRFHDCSGPRRRGLLEYDSAARITVKPASRSRRVLMS
jgi:hypothetical protein